MRRRREHRRADEDAGRIDRLRPVADRRCGGLSIGRSADDAEQFRDAHDIEAEALVGAHASEQVTAALIGVTRSMIARARGAEEKLRSVNEELETVRAISPMRASRRA
jgi:hypothetical protein